MNNLHPLPPEHAAKKKRFAFTAANAGVALLLVGLLLGIALLLLLPRLQETKSRQQLDEGITVLEQSLRDSVNSTNAVPPSTAALDKFIASAKAASKNLKGAEAVAMQAGLSYFAKLKTETEIYTKAVDALQKADILNGDLIKTKEQLAPRRKVVQAFLDANRQFQEFVRDSDKHFEIELKTRLSNPADITKAMDGFHKGNSRNAVLLKIRDTDERIGKGLLGTLDLIDQQWGQWKFDAKKDEFIFQDAEAAKKYAALQKESDDAAEEQAALQRQLVNSLDTKNAGAR